MVKEFKEYPDLITYYFDSEDHCDFTIKYFEELFIHNNLPMDLCIRFLEDEMYEEYVRHFLIVKYSEKQEIKKTDFVKMVLHIYKYYEVGQKLKITEVCKRNDYVENRFRNALESLWETEYKRSGSDRYTEIIKRRNIVLTKAEQFDLYRSTMFGKTFFNEISEEQCEKIKKQIIK